MSAEPKYDVYKHRGNRLDLLASRLSADEAARLIDVDLNDLLAAIDASARCDCERYVAVAADDPPPERLER